MTFFDKGVRVRAIFLIFKYSSVGIFRNIKTLLDVVFGACFKDFLIFTPSNLSLTGSAQAIKTKSGLETLILDSEHSSLLQYRQVVRS